MQEAQNNMTASEFMRAAGFLSHNKDEVRENLQSTTASEMKRIVQKLKGNDSLNADEIKCMKLWIVGDAESYVAMENNFKEWLAEFERLKGVVAGYENRELSFDDLFKLQGILEDAVRLSADIGNFLEKKERMAKFQEATQNQASLDREILVRILEEKLKSPLY